MSHTFSAWRFYAIKRIRDSQLLIFVDAHRMIRQYIYALDIAERREKIAQFFQVFILVGNTWNKDVTNPYRLVNLTEIAGTIEYVLIGMKRKLLMLFIVDMLDIQKNCISNSHQTLEFLEDFSLSSERLGRCIETGIDTSLMGFLEEFDEKVYLHQGFSTTHGNTSLISPITLESLCLVQKVIGCPLFSYPRLPGIRVVAELAAHRTTLQKDQKSDAWSIYRTKALYTVNKTFMHNN